MLPKRLRLPKESFPAKSQGRIIAGRFFSLKVVSSPGSDSRFSFVVSGKVARTAVARNRLRRRGYAAVASRSKTLKSGHSLVFFAKAGAAAAPFDDLSLDINRLLDELRL